MIPSQTSQILFGTVVALLYAGAVLTIGMLPLAVSIGRPASATVRARIGLFGFMWLGFVMGQGILGVIWLALALAGNLYAWLIWMSCALGWFVVGGMLLAYRRQAVQAIRLAWSGPLSFLHSRLWYSWLGVGVFIVVLFNGVSALVPPGNDDALKWYLTVAKVISFSHTAELQPFTIPHSGGLIQSLIEIHWAALFAIANETAVTVWDYLCALSFLCGLGLLSWSLTSSRRVALLAVLLMLSTPGFYELMGRGKADNAAAQYGIAAFLWLVLWPVLGRRSVILAGLCAGWLMATRYTNVIVLPALMVFTVMVVHRTWKACVVDGAREQWKSAWGTDVLVGSIAAGVGVAPQLIKNWLLVGCPLAPLFGCRDMFWAYRIPLQNISVIDVLFYPFVWTFAYRDTMLGNLSPLFLGFFPFLVAYRHFSIARPAWIAGFAGLASITTWLLIEPLVLFTRWLLVPLGLLAVPLSASVVAVEQDLHRSHRVVCWFVRSAIFIVLLFLLFQSRSVVYGIRYLASTDSRAARYELTPGYDVATWLNAHVQPGQRVALGGWSGYPYFVSPNHLLNSESAEEHQWLWERYRGHSPSSWTANSWHFYARHGFTYVIVAKELVEDAVRAWPDDTARARPQVAFVGRKDAVLRIAQQETH